MLEALIAFFSAWPRPIATMVMSMLPITELQASIPVAMHVWSMTPGEALGWAYVGNLAVFFPLFFGLEKLRMFLERYLPRLVRPIDALLVRGQGKLAKQYATYGAIALAMFIAIPTPFTGVWTATFAAVALKISFRPALFGIALGLLSAGIMVTVISTTVGAVT